MARAVYAGSFDPITNGHMWMIEEGARLFPELIVAIGINPEKDYTFSLDERIEMLSLCIKNFPSVRADAFEGMFLASYAAKNRIDYILRGIRNEGDYEYEKGMRYINSEINPDVRTVFLVPPKEFSEISSSMVKSLIGPSGWEEVVRKYVPEQVYEKMIQKFRK